MASGVVSGAQLGSLRGLSLQAPEAEVEGNLTGQAPAQSPHPLGAGSRTSADLASLYRAHEGLSLSKQSLGSFLFKGPSDQDWTTAT